ncbi:ABC transporter permease [Streptomyces chartreusis]
MFLTEEAVGNILPSLGRMAAGFGIAAVAGITLGIAIGRSRRVYALCDPVLQFARAVPPPDLVLVFVVILDFDTPMQFARCGRGLGETAGKSARVEMNATRPGENSRIHPSFTRWCDHVPRRGCPSEAGGRPRP